MAFLPSTMMYIIRLHFKCTDVICRPVLVQCESIAHERTGAGQKNEEKRHS